MPINKDAINFIWLLKKKTAMKFQQLLLNGLCDANISKVWCQGSLGVMLRFSSFPSSMFILKFPLNFSANPKNLDLSSSFFLLWNRNLQNLNHPALIRFTNRKDLWHCSFILFKGTVHTAFVLHHMDHIYVWFFYLIWL